MSSGPLIDAYLAGIGSVRAAVEGLDADELHARPEASAQVGTWSPLEVVCHLADSEALFADRMKRVLIEERPQFAFSDPALAAAALAYLQRDAQEELAFLAAQPPEAWGRIGIHSRQGEQTLEQLLRKAVDHLEHHVRFLREKRQALERKSCS